MSRAWSEDALGSPLLLSKQQSPVLSASSSDGEATLPARKNRQAEERMKEGDRGRKRRKVPSAKRSRTQSEEDDQESQGDQEILAAPAEPKTKRIKRPRRATYFCPDESCPMSKEGYTRCRDFELHVASHNCPIYQCIPCNTEYNRDDNYKKHLKSKKHLKTMNTLQAERAAEAAASPVPTSSVTSFSPSSLLDEHLPFPELPSQNEHSPLFYDIDAAERQEKLASLFAQREEAIQEAIRKVQSVDSQIAELQEKQTL